MDRKQVKARQQALVEAYNKTWDKKPTDTLAELEAKIGHEEARLAVAELVRGVGAWDGRVYDYVRAWADRVPGAASKEEMEAASIYRPDTIHSVHINQLGQAYERNERAA